MIAGFIVVNGAPALAASGCGSRCDGKDPSVYQLAHPPESIFCADDATTPRSATIPITGRVIQLRYSPYCRTAWARLAGAGTPCICYYTITVKSYTSSTTNTVRLVEDEVDDNNPNYYPGWTYMVDDAGLWAKACAVYHWASSEEDPYTTEPEVCTSRY